MRSNKLLIAALTIVVVLALATQSYADISNAAVLYLRIAPGARAAGMGEAYVAIADDATSTHWNPAGLGAYPLSPGWLQASVPVDLRPLMGVAALKTRGGGSYTAYDIWALTPKGLARFDNKDWYVHEDFSTRTDQTVEGMVASYFNLTDPDRIAAVVRNVARSNSEKSYGYVDSLKARVLAAVPADYSAMASLTDGFDTLLAGYDRCLIDWSMVDETEHQLAEGLKDGALTEKEADRINFAVEKARTRFIPEQLNIEYSAFVEGQPHAITSARQFLILASDQGVYSYNGRRWQSFTTANGLPSNKVTALAGSDDYVLIATDKGIVKTDGLEFAAVGEPGELPEGDVSAVAFGESLEVWAVVNNKLYHYNGESWADHFDYQVVIDDTVERIADKLAVYGTDEEKQALVAAINELNTVAPAEGAEAGPLNLEPGKTIKAPYAMGFKGDVSKVFVAQERLWVGTSYGVVYREGNTWELPGYRPYTVKAGDRLSDLLTAPGTSTSLDAAAYKAAVMDINGLKSEELTEGQTVKIYRNPTVAPVYAIESRHGHVYFATSLGMLEFDGTVWSKSEIHGLESANVKNVRSVDDELWFAGDERIVYKANSKTDISMMYVKWLPELADDLYYAFFSAASHVEGWGTFGGSFTYISYGTITRTLESSPEAVDTFDSYDFALTGSWGTSVTDKLKAGVSAKLLVSKLSEQGAGEEKGEGSSVGFAIDFGFLYHMTPRLNFGLAITNLGPEMAYIDAAQSDPLPLNLALGVAYKVLQTDYYHFLVTGEINKSLVGVDDKFRDELEQLVLNGGGEFLYANILAIRAGYIYDQEGDIKTATLGIGLGPVGIFRFDFSYIPSNNDLVLENTLRISFAIQP